VSVLQPRVQLLEAQQLQTSNAVAALQNTAAATTTGWMLHDLDGTAILTISTGVTGTWTTWQVPGVPAGATHVQMECWSAQNQPDGVTYLNFLYLRANVSGVQLVGCAGRSAASSDATGSAMQGMFPLDPSGSIQYYADTNFVNWQIRAVGYWK
jgi:hypothetical protein